MTNRDRAILLSIFISVFGFSLLNVVNPLDQQLGKPFVVTSEYISKVPLMDEEYAYDYNFDIDRQYSRFDSSKSKLVNMLSISMGISTEDVQEALEGGMKPSEMLAEEGILLSDLEEDFNFELVGDREFVRFNL